MEYILTPRPDMAAIQQLVPTDGSDCPSMEVSASEAIRRHPRYLVASCTSDVLQDLTELREATDNDSECHVRLLVQEALASLWVSEAFCFGS